ncbi:MAG: YlbF family regulator [Planctomycetota bacterium]
MADTQELLTRAHALGEALAAHPMVQAHFEAQRALQADAAAQQLLRDYQQHLARIRQLEAEQKPIEVADKHKLRDLEQRLAGHATLKALMRSQADYVALWSQVDQAIHAPLAALSPGESPA